MTKKAYKAKMRQIGIAYFSNILSQQKHLQKRYDIMITYQFKLQTIVFHKPCLVSICTTSHSLTQDAKPWSPWFANYRKENDFRCFLEKANNYRKYTYSKTIQLFSKENLMYFLKIAYHCSVKQKIWASSTFNSISLRWW